jgi:catabolite repression HPr-like protein
MTQKEVEIKLQNGLEARPVAVLVQVASKYESTIYLEAEGKRINAKSIMGMMSLGMKSGEKVVVSANGSDEAAAVEDIEHFLSGCEAE